MTSANWLDDDTRPDRRSDPGCWVRCSRGRRTGRSQRAVTECRLAVIDSSMPGEMQPQGVEETTAAPAEPIRVHDSGEVVPLLHRLRCSLAISTRPTSLVLFGAAEMSPTLTECRL